ncbi:MAG TPA: sugar phosphate isomerase/epimerase family protein [Acidobacteriaceae bacterium]|nr:sugar phosphate isomerase/epimerase family protein [Acidobacteriaceae bacterium]
MQPGISTHVFFQHRLHPGLLDALASAGARTIEVSAARHHFDYTDTPAVRELASWFRSNDVRAVLRQPIYITDRADTQWSRHVAPNLNLIAPEKTHRIAAMDEVKRAIESAEQVPFAAVVLSLGLAHSTWDDAAIENSLTAIEHLKAFASPLGVRLLLENGENEVTTPEHLLYILRAGHFDSVGVSLDIGHLHLAQDAPPSAPTQKSQSESRPDPSNPTPSPWVSSAITLLGDRIAQLHLHDNHGPFSDSAEMKDEHLWPGEGTIDWPGAIAALAPIAATTPAILAPTADREEPATSITRKAAAAFRALE